MQEDTLHILVVMGVTVTMVMISVIVGMPVAMVGMSKCCEANDVHEET
jgi:hypothetical protein